MNFSNLVHWAIIFFIIAIVAAFLGFGGVAGTAMAGAKMVFWFALIIAAISLVMGMLRRA